MINCCQLCYIILWFRPYPYSLLVTLIVVDKRKMIQGLLSIWIWNLNKYSVCVLSSNVHRVIWQYCDVQAPWIYIIYINVIVIVWEMWQFETNFILLWYECDYIINIANSLRNPSRINCCVSTKITQKHVIQGLWYIITKWPSYRLFYIPC